MTHYSATEYSRDTTFEDVAAEMRSAGARSNRALPEDDQEWCHALAASRRELAAALRLIDDLQGRNSLLGERVTALEQQAAAASQFAYRDALTGLANRHLLLDRFNQVAARARRRHQELALLFLDLDGFKRINDALGHTAGDELLRQVATRLTACVRTSDTVCRYGGDEFVVLLPEFERHECIVAAVEKIRAPLAMPFMIGRAAIKVTASVGVAVYPNDGHDLDDLIHAADRAMYCSKARGPGSPPGVLDYEPVKQRLAAISVGR